MRRFAGVLVATVVAGLGLIGGTAAHAQPAPTPAAQVQPAQVQPAQPNGKLSVQYTSYNGVCEVGEVCLYYNSNCQGSFADFGGWVDDFAGYTFRSSGAGKGQPVKNNAASARNRDGDWTARIWFNSGQKGSYDNIAPSTPCQNLQNTYNENASLSWYQ
ncbi:peptidase inhibitor family I36 protein [Amycolatopsis pithecellobii]|uniref:Peptidase inhibitor family I36 n=1 Tax=Amycolatopsis pithecellobii TaxID=664692 RepID=A0A6N7Z0L1_9PSEU|nr:peptidase inhibitor family I36 protein [Amycolatopsis pithecellobii]MTD53301.1 hypothetical protein [Amycolatopsis pithecellobii]